MCLEFAYAVVGKASAVITGTSIGLVADLGLDNEDSDETERFEINLPAQTKRVDL